MDKYQIIKKVKELNLAPGSFVVFGSCPLAATGLRLAQDIDLLVSKDVLERLAAEGWVRVDKGTNDRPLTYDVFEAHDNWDFSSYSPTLDELLNRADDYDGVPFASLQDVLEWKKASGRPKDLVDIKLIDTYFNK